MCNKYFDPNDLNNLVTPRSGDNNSDDSSDEGGNNNGGGSNNNNNNNNGSGCKSHCVAYIPGTINGPAGFNLKKK